MISVIIPTLQEEDHLISLLENIQKKNYNCEIIVADGGSTDRTRDIASSRARLVVSQKGRGRQLNAGALQAKGEILFFLHSDCRVGPGVFAEIEKAVRDGWIGGCLTQKISDPRWIFRAIEFSGNLRAGLQKIFFGDQGIFVRKDVFESMKGFKAIPLFEDVEFSKRLKQRGKTGLLSKTIFTSNRRWVRQGILKTTLINRVLITLYHLGVSAQLLAKWYPDVRLKNT